MSKLIPFVFFWICEIFKLFISTLCWIVSLTINNLDFETERLSKNKLSIISSCKLLNSTSLFFRFKYTSKPSRWSEASYWLSGMKGRYLVFNVSNDKIVSELLFDNNISDITSSPFKLNLELRIWILLFVFVLTKSTILFLIYSWKPGEFIVIKIVDITRNVIPEIIKTIFFEFLMIILD